MQHHVELQDCAHLFCESGLSMLPSVYRLPFCRGPVEDPFLSTRVCMEHGIETGKRRRSTKTHKNTSWLNQSPSSHNWKTAKITAQWLISRYVNINKVKMILCKNTENMLHYKKSEWLNMAKKWLKMSGFWSWHNKNIKSVICGVFF